jgi:four helix bundle protein
MSATPEQPGFIPPHGNYRELLSYQKAEVVFDLTYRFCKRFLSKGDRTIDQMVQAARSGKQNIVEGSKASGTSKETEIKLFGVARKSRKIAAGLLRFSSRVWFSNLGKGESPSPICKASRDQS